MNESEEEFQEKEISKSLSSNHRSPYLPLLETEERNLQANTEFYSNPQIKRLVLFAMELQLNLTTVRTIIRALDFNQPEEMVRNQLLDLYYQETPLPDENMVNPEVLLRSFSQKITTVTPKKGSKESEILKKSSGSEGHFIVEIEPHKKEMPIQLNGLCPICFDENEKLDKLACGHEFCETCILDYFRNKINLAQVNVFKCPAEKCGFEIKDELLKSYLSREAGLIEKYEKFKLRAEIAQDPTRRFCIKAGCEAVIKKDPLANYGKCEVCSQEICFQCGNAWHPKESNCLLAMDNVFQEYLQKVDSKNCPKCHQIIEKSVGCNVMACPYCQFTFCWLCLKEYKIGHFSVFNLNGCPGMDSVSYGKDASKSRRMLEKVRGICGFFLKMLYFFVIGLLIYPVLPIICIFFLLKEERKTAAVSGCNKARCKKICGAVCCGLFAGIIAYVLYPLGFLGLFCYMCICNPHVAYPYQMLRGNMNNANPDPNVVNNPENKNPNANFPNATQNTLNSPKVNPNGSMQNLRNEHNA